ncbi:unnamed protein product, partial [Oppiella nova]
MDLVVDLDITGVMVAMVASLGTMAIMVIMVLDTEGLARVALAMVLVMDLEMVLIMASE